MLNLLQLEQSISLNLYKKFYINILLKYAQGGVGIRMSDRRLVGRSSRQAWKNKFDLAQKKV